MKSHKYFSITKSFRIGRLTDQQLQSSITKSPFLPVTIAFAAPVVANRFGVLKWTNFEDQNWRIRLTHTKNGTHHPTDCKTHFLLLRNIFVVSLVTIILGASISFDKLFSTGFSNSHTYSFTKRSFLTDLLISDNFLHKGCSSPQYILSRVLNITQEKL